MKLFHCKINQALRCRVNEAPQKYNSRNDLSSRARRQRVVLIKFVVINGGGALSEDEMLSAGKHSEPKFGLK